jgi:hypothetical protein
MRKPNSTAKLLNLPEEQQSQLAEWLLDGMPYHTAQEVVKKDFGVATSQRALSQFWQEVCGPALLMRRRRAVSMADEVAQEAAKAPGQFDTATIEALKQKAFELSIAPGANPKDVKSLFMLVLKARDQQHDEAKLKLDREKFETMTAEKMLDEALRDRAAEIANSNLSHADKIAAMRQAAFADVDALQASGEIKLPE